MTSSAMADEWPHWMGADRTGAWSAKTLDEFPADGPNIVWRSPIGPGYAGPAVVGNHVYVLDRTSDAGKGATTENNIRKAGEIAGGERIVCLNRASGAIVWEHTYDCPYNIAYPTGPRCTPSVDQDRVYTLGAMGDLICFRRSDGSILWQKKLTEEYGSRPPLWGFASHPRVDGDLLLVPAGGEGSAVVAFNKLTGEEVWKAGTTTDIGYAPLAIYEPPGKERQLIFWHGTGVSSFNPADGDEYWTIKFPNKKQPSVVTIATPQIVGNQLFIAEFYTGALLLELGSAPPSAKEVYRQEGVKSPLKPSFNCMMSTPFIRDGLAYGVGYNSRGAGVLRCCRVESGEELWVSSDWLAAKPLMFANGFIIPNGEKQWIFNDLGELMICELSPDGFEERDRVKILEPTSVARGRSVVWSHPAVAGTQMFVRNDKEIVCVDLSRK